MIEACWPHRNCLSTEIFTSYQHLSRPVINETMDSFDGQIAKKGASRNSLCTEILSSVHPVCNEMQVPIVGIAK